MGINIIIIGVITAPEENKEVKMESADINKITPNSHSFNKEAKKKPEKEKIDPIVKGDKVHISKKSPVEKFVKKFLKQDVEDLKSYIINDVIRPRITDLLLDTIEAALTGGSRRSHRRGYTPYSSIYKGNSRSSRKEEPARRYDNEKVDYKKIILTNRRDAEEVVDRLRDRIERYNEATVADLLQLIDAPSTYQDNNWGWKNPRDIGVQKVSGGFLIDVEEAEFLD